MRLSRFRFIKHLVATGQLSDTPAGERCACGEPLRYLPMDVIVRAQFDRRADPRHCARCGACNCGPRGGAA